MTIETQISLQAQVCQLPGHIVSDMAGEKVMLSVQQGNYYNLGEVGGRIWDLIAEPIAVEALVGQLMTEYAVEQSVCQAHVLSFLEQLTKQGLIAVTPDTRL